MMRRKVQHIPMHLSRRHKTTLYLQLACQDRHIRHVQVVARDAERVDGASGRHDGQKLLPVWLLGCRDEEVVDGAGYLELFYAFCGDEFRGAEFGGFFLFAVGCREHDDLAAHLSSELNSQMTQSSDTDNADAVGWLGAEAVQGVEDGSAAAHERCCEFAGDG